MYTPSRCCVLNYRSNFDGAPLKSKSIDIQIYQQQGSVLAEVAVVFPRKGFPYNKSLKDLLTLLHEKGYQMQPEYQDPVIRKPLSVQLQFPGLIVNAVPSIFTAVQNSSVKISKGDLRFHKQSVRLQSLAATSCYSQ